MLNGLNVLGWCALNFLAQSGGGTPSGPPQDPMSGFLNMLVLFLPLIIIFWVMIWRPESKRRHERQQRCPFHRRRFSDH